MSTPKKGLGSKGRGLEALINIDAQDEQQENEKAVLEIDINKIEPNRSQPRKHFDETALLELSESLKQYGMLQPVVVKKVNNYYELIAGERRFRGAKIAGLTKIPAIIKDFKEQESFEVALVENLQRENLNPMEEASSFYRLQNEFSLSQEEIAKKVGKSRSVVANSLRLLNLDNRVQNFISENKISNGHGRALLSITEGEMQFELAEKIIEEGLSVRTTEAIVKKMLDNIQAQVKQNSEDKKLLDSSNYKNIEQELKSILSTKVKISGKKNKGKIEIEYYSNDDLDRLIGMFKSNMNRFDKI